MRMHYSRFGYMTACGKRLSDTRYLTRTLSRLTCRTCKRVHGA